MGRYPVSNSVTFALGAASLATIRSSVFVNKPGAIPFGLRMLF